MKAIMVMYDTLNRHFLPNYGCQDIIAPNFQRLGERTVTFDNAYVGSMPCMPARRELHTGRLNFLHRSWSPLEPFDDSMPELLRKSDIHTHMVSDHQHYWEDGGATYHQRFSTWEAVRGQEGDKWKANLSPEVQATASFGAKEVSEYTLAFQRQDAVNRLYMQPEEAHPQSVTFEKGLAFLDTNHSYDNWFLQIETFDPHEPFFSTTDYENLYPKGSYCGPDYDWPPYGPCQEGEDLVAHIRRKYMALLSMCDKNLGRVLDKMDRYNLWEDTMLIVNTDHGYLLGEHQWWSKSIMPLYDEICHIPLFIWDPRSRKTGIRNQALVQTIDLAPTLLAHFGVDIPEDMQGLPLGETIAKGTHTRDYALFGYFGAHVNVTDGRYVYMHSPTDSTNSPIYEYTLMPCHMRERFHPDEMARAEMHEGFSFTKGSRVMKIEIDKGAQQFHSWHRYGDKLYDLQEDPAQQRPLENPGKALELANAALALMRENDAPPEQYLRLGFPETGSMTMEMLRCRKQAQKQVKLPAEISEFQFTAPAAEQVRVLMSLAGSGEQALLYRLREYLAGLAVAHIDTREIEIFAESTCPDRQKAMLQQLLRLAARTD